MAVRTARRQIDLSLLEIISSKTKVSLSRLIRP